MAELRPDLQIAAVTGNVELLRAASPAEINAADKRGCTPLHLALAHPSTVQALINDCGAEVDALDGRGLTALHRAARDGQARSLQLLLNAQASCSIQANLGGHHTGGDCGNALHMAAIHGQDACLRVLLQYGEAAEATTTQGRTVLDCAAQSGSLPATQVACQSATREPTVAALRKAAESAGAVGHTAVAQHLQELVARKQHATTHQKRAHSQLLREVRKGHVKAVSQWLQRHADVDLEGVVDKRGWCVLHVCVQLGHADVLRALLEARPTLDVDAPSEKGWTPLHVAAANGQATCAQLLLSHGASPDWPTATGADAAQVAIAAGHTDIAAMVSACCLSVARAARLLSSANAEMQRSAVSGGGTYTSDTHSSTSGGAWLGSGAPPLGVDAGCTLPSGAFAGMSGLTALDHRELTAATAHGASATTPADSGTPSAWQTPMSRRKRRQVRLATFGGSIGSGRQRAADPRWRSAGKPAKSWHATPPRPAAAAAATAGSPDGEPPTVSMGRAPLSDADFPSLGKPSELSVPPQLLRHSSAASSNVVHSRASASPTSAAGRMPRKSSADSESIASLPPLASCAAELSPDSLPRPEMAQLLELLGLAEHAGALAAAGWTDLPALALAEDEDLQKLSLPQGHARLLCHAVQGLRALLPTNKPGELLKALLRPPSLAMSAAKAKHSQATSWSHLPSHMGMSLTESRQPLPPAETELVEGNGAAPGRASVVDRAGLLMAGGLHTLDKSEITEFEQIGTGAFGVVRRGMWRGMQVAVKRLCFAPTRTGRTNSEHELLQEMLHEARVMSRVCHHDHVVEFVGVVLGADPVVVTKYCAQGNLASILVGSGAREPRMPLADRVNLLAQAAAGVLHLHREMIIHRDLACRNILVSGSGVVKVSDFGFCRLKAENQDTGHTDTQVGPVRWMCPESLRNRVYNEKTDAYSFGVVMWEALTGKSPWKSVKAMDVVVRVCNGERLPIPADMPAALAGLIQACWAADPAARPTMHEILRVLTNWKPAEPARQPAPPVAALVRSDSGVHVAPPSPLLASYANMPTGVIPSQSALYAPALVPELKL